MGNTGDTQPLTGDYRGSFSQTPLGAFVPLLALLGLSEHSMRMVLEMLDLYVLEQQKIEGKRAHARLTMEENQDWLAEERSQYEADRAQRKVRRPQKVRP